MMKKIILTLFCMIIFMSCSIKVYNGITIVPQSSMGLGDVYCFGVKASPGNNGWYTLTMDSPSSNTATLDIDGTKKRVTVDSIEFDSTGKCISITIDGDKYTSQ